VDIFAAELDDADDELAVEQQQRSGDADRGLVSLSSAATASVRWWDLVAPMIGALTTGFLSTQAMATWAVETPRAVAICWTASTIALSLSSKSGRPNMSTVGLFSERVDPCPPIVKRFHRLLDRRLRVEAVDLVEVDVVGAEALQRRVDHRRHRPAHDPTRNDRDDGHHPPDRADALRRYLTIFLDGMRGDRGPISELPVDALSLDKASHAFRTSGEQQPNFAPNSKR
jgi:hypothetical protein